MPTYEERYQKGEFLYSSRKDNQLSNWLKKNHEDEWKNQKIRFDEFSKMLSEGSLVYGHSPLADSWLSKFHLTGQ